MEVLSREVSKDGDNFVILENIKKIYTKNDLLNELQNIQRQKLFFIDQSKKIKQDYDNLVLKESELKALLDADGDSEFEEILI